MNRHTAREIALHIIFAGSFRKDKDGFKIEDFINPENFLSLKNTEELHDVYAKLPDNQQNVYIKSVVDGVNSKTEELDEIIAKYSVGWKINRISKTAMAILRLALYEILYMSDIPPAVSINEAVEFAKQYDSDENASFINGVLGSALRGLKNADKPE